jgi:hypothetical protein
MENVVKLTPRLPGPDPQREHSMAIRDVQLSLAQNARTLMSCLASLGESLQKADSLICYINDAEVRAQLRLTSESTHLEMLNAVTKLLGLAAVCQKTNA